MKSSQKINWDIQDFCLHCKTFGALKMHHLWSVFSPVIFAAIGKQFLRQVWAYMRSLQWLPSVKNRLGALCKQLCKQIGGWGRTGANNQLSTGCSGVRDGYKQKTERSAVPLETPHIEAACVYFGHICYCNVHPRPAWNNRRLPILRQITSLLSRLQSDDIFAQGGHPSLLQHRAKRGNGGTL